MNDMEPGAIDEATAARMDIVLCDLGGKTRGVFSSAPEGEADLWERMKARWAQEFGS